MALVGRGIQGGSAFNALMDPGATGDIQVIKLGYSALGSESLVLADVNGLLVQLAGNTASTATLSNQADQATNVTLLAANSARKGVIIHNDSPSTLYIKFGATASATSFSVKMPADAYWEMPQPIYTGQIDGIWSSDSTGSARITEL